MDAYKALIFRLPRVPQARRCEVCGADNVFLNPRWACVVSRQPGYVVRHQRVWTLCAVCAWEADSTLPFAFLPPVGGTLSSPGFSLAGCVTGRLSCHAHVQERVRIDVEGNVGLFRPPQQRLEVAGALDVNIGADDLGTINETMQAAVGLPGDWLTGPIQNVSLRRAVEEVRRVWFPVAGRPRGGGQPPNPAD